MTKCLICNCCTPTPKPLEEEMKMNFKSEERTNVTFGTVTFGTPMKEENEMNYTNIDTVTLGTNNEEENEMNEALVMNAQYDHLIELMIELGDAESSLDNLMEANEIAADDFALGIQAIVGQLSDLYKKLMKIGGHNNPDGGNSPDTTDDTREEVAVETAEEETTMNNNVYGIHDDNNNLVGALTKDGQYFFGENEYPMFDEDNKLVGYLKQGGFVFFNEEDNNDGGDDSDEQEVVVEEEEKEEEKEMDLVKVKEVMEARMDKRVSNYLGEGHTVKETILMVHDTIKIAEKNAMSSNEKKAKGAMFAGAYLMGTVLPQLEDVMVKEAEEEPAMDDAAQARFDKMSEQLDGIKETLRNHSKGAQEKKASFEEKVKESFADKNVATETDKLFEKADEIKEKASDVAKSTSKKLGVFAKKAEAKFGSFVGEKLVDSAKKKAAQSRQ